MPGYDNRRMRHMENVKEVDVHDTDFLRRLMTEHGKILPARLTGASPIQQRRIKKAIRRARTMGLLR